MSLLVLWINRLNRWWGTLAAWLCLLLILLTAEQVISRYLFESSSIALQELEWHLFGALFLLACPYTLQKNGHVRIDLLYGRFSEKTQALIDTLGILFLLLPVSVLLVYYGVLYTDLALDVTNTRAIDYYTASYFDKDGTLYSLFSPLEHFLRQYVLVGEISPDPGGLEARWIIKALIPFSFFFMLLQGLALLIEKIAVLIGKQGAA
ncbi:MAG: TRAP transporter small permease subunit [Bdellovibrionales bacterium]|nr:TRAP transporter small permease subunit [Bdellovibrionales bacterium]